MTHFLDSFPFDWSDPAAQELRQFLISKYPLRGEALQLVGDAGVPVGEINWDQPMQLVWHEIITVARGHDELRGLLDLIATRGGAPVKARLDELIGPEPVLAAVTEEPPPGWGGFDDHDALEKQIAAEPTFLDVTFLKRGVELAPAVARLLVTVPSGKYHGTAFHIGNNVMLTNHHVLFDDKFAGEPASAVEAWFGYEKAFGGDTLAHTVVMGDPNSIEGDKVHDWAIVKMPVPAGTPTIALTGAKPPDAEDRVYIIQHPHGEVKKIGMVHNVVRCVDDNVVQYWTDTEQGSSGSPVFNEKWQVVALHQRSVEVPVSKAFEYRNQGRRIERVVEGLTAIGEP